MAQPTWNTTAGSIGTFAALISTSIQISATAVAPATTITYTLLSGSLPAGLTLSSAGLISGIPSVVIELTTSIFVIRATDNLGNIRDRTFSITISGSAIPQITTPQGQLMSINDSTWIEYQVGYTNLISSNPVTMTITSGTLPPGLEMNDNGLIRGYAEIPINEIAYPAVSSLSTSTSGNTITCVSTVGFVVGRAVVFTGTSFGGIVSGTTYYIKNIIDGASFSVSATQNGDELTWSTASGSLTTTLPLTTVGQPTIRTYSFAIRLSSPLGTDVKPYYITVVNQNTPVAQGGPGLPTNSRIPTIYNTRPDTFNINDSINYGYYILPPPELGYDDTYPPSVQASMGTLTNNYFSFKIMGHDFDGNNLSYVYGNLPPGLIGNANSGWISGFTPSIHTGVDQYAFSATVYKTLITSVTAGSFVIGSPYVIVDAGTTDFTALGASSNDSGIYFLATSTGLVTTGSFVIGKSYTIAFVGDTDFTLIGAASNTVGVTFIATGVGGGTTGTATQGSGSANLVGVHSSTFNFKFNVAVNISDVVTWITPSDIGTVYNQTLSIKYVEAIADVPLNYMLSSGSLPPNLTLLSTGEITGYIADQPTSDLQSVGNTNIFTFSVTASSPEFSAITSTKQFTLTVLQKFATPTDTLYIKASPDIEDRILIDSLLTNDALIPENMIYRPNDINFGKATAVVYEHAYGIYASDINEYLNAITTNHYWRNITLGALKTAAAKDDTGAIIYEVVYSEVIDNLVAPSFATVNAGQFSLGVTYTIKYPGNTDWVSIGAANNLAGTTFTATGAGIGTGTATTITSTTSVSSSIYWPYPIIVNDIPLERTLYPNSLTNMRNKVANVLGQELDYNLLPLWMTSQQENGSTLGYTQAWVICYTKPGYATTIKNNIETLWVNSSGTVNTLNSINFKIDRFSVDKSMTYNYNNLFSPAAWTSLPSADPTPNPIDSQDFYVLFPQKTILPPV